MAIRALLSLRDAEVETKRRNDLASHIKMTMSPFSVLNFIKRKQQKKYSSAKRTASQKTKNNAMKKIL